MAAAGLVGSRCRGPQPRAGRTLVTKGVWVGAWSGAQELAWGRLQSMAVTDHPVELGNE